MRTLNDIPDYLRGPEQAPLTFWQALRRGAIFTLLSSCVIAIGMGGIGYVLPLLVHHIVLNFAWVLSFPQPVGVNQFPGTLGGWPLISFGAIPWRRNRTGADVVFV